MPFGEQNCLKREEKKGKYERKTKKEENEK
jgi:hypothetical protein